MSLYDRYVLPRLIDAACSTGPVMKLRGRAVPRCAGVVLEVGAGSGINFPLYDPTRVTRVYALEPSEGMRAAAAAHVVEARVPITWIDLPGEAVPLPDASVDTVLLTYTLCTIPDPEAALAQIVRVLKPGGRLVYAEHGAAPDPGVRAWQARLTPAWSWFAGGCHLDRPVSALIAASGLRRVEEDAAYLPKTPRVLGHVTVGVAEKPT